MELEFRFRNNDMGMLFPTFQERVNAMLPAQKAEAETEASAARELDPGCQAQAQRATNSNNIRAVMIPDNIAQPPFGACLPRPCR